MSLTIIILAMIAAFLGLRLYSALGKHGTDHEPALPGGDERVRAAVKAPPRIEESGAAPTASRSSGMVYEPDAEIGIRAILAVDRQFDVGRFVTGAQAAYRMILEAYWRGDREELRGLCDADSFAAFETAIAAREARGETLDNRLVTIDRAVITSAGLSSGVAKLSVRFEADIAAITRDAEGRVIAGSMTDAVATTDRWSFVRTVNSADPTWLLDETDAD